MSQNDGFPICLFHKLRRFHCLIIITVPASGCGRADPGGRRGPDRSQALNLGIFYQDNATKKRWVLKFNDPKTLAQIDAVFVTVEPGSGSRKPSGKPLLFAYLKMDANHP